MDTAGATTAESTGFSGALFAAAKREKARSAGEKSPVGSVVAGGAAAKAGIAKGDLLLSVDGTPVNSLADLTAAVNAAAPHHSAEFEMSRDGATRDVTISL
jgi:S1-C subfamily serine protease